MEYNSDNVSDKAKPVGNLTLLFVKELTKPDSKCSKAIQLLKEKEIPFVEVNVEGDNILGTIKPPALFHARCVGGIDVIRSAYKLREELNIGKVTKPHPLPKHNSSYPFSKEAPARLTLKGEEETAHFRTKEFSYNMESLQARARMISENGQGIRGKISLWAKHFYFEPEDVLEMKNGVYLRLVTLAINHITELRVNDNYEEFQRKEIFVTSDEQVLTFKYRPTRKKKISLTKKEKLYLFVVNKQKSKKLCYKLAQSVSNVLSETLESELHVDRAVLANNQNLEDVLNLFDKSKVFRPPTLIKELYKFLPHGARLNNLKLLFSTNTHGTSMHTFYKRCSEDSLTILAVRDTEGYVFGYFATEVWHSDVVYYGTGESFLWTVHPEVHAYKWTRANEYFQFSNAEQLLMGGGTKKKNERLKEAQSQGEKEKYSSITTQHGLYLGDGFSKGSSDMSDTYFNRCLASANEFQISSVEVWGFTLSNVVETKQEEPSNSGLLPLTAL